MTSDDGQAIQLKPEERELAKSIAQRLVLDEIQAAILLLAWKRHRAGDELTQTKLETNDDFWTDFTLFTFSERLDVINTVTHLLKIGESGSARLSACLCEDIMLMGAVSSPTRCRQ